MSMGIILRRGICIRDVAFSVKVGGEEREGGAWWFIMAG